MAVIYLSYFGLLLLSVITATIECCPNGSVSSNTSKNGNQKLMLRASSSPSRLPTTEKSIRTVSSHTEVEITENQVLVSSEVCPPWFIHHLNDNGSATCECGHSLNGVVQCGNTSHQSKILRCYCMTYSWNSNVTVIGHCLYSCFDHHGQLYYPMPKDASELMNNAICTKFNRSGQLCGKCIDGFAPPVYSFSFQCVACKDYDNNWLKYIGIAFGPLTVFFLLVIFCRISITTAELNGFILSSQLIALPQQMRILAGVQHFRLVGSGGMVVINILAAVYGVWNLDFFRFTYTPFCLRPNMTNLQVLALDYVSAVYPLVLLIITYFLVALHDSGNRIIMWLWKPFHWCLSRFRRQWNIKTSLIDAFATFLLLSYVKLLSISFDILVPTQLLQENGKPTAELYLFYDGSVELFKAEHKPYAIVAFVIIIVFILFPLLLLCLYPCRCFQQALNKCGCRFFALHAFMDVFQGCYKCGTGNTWDCRCFSTVYLLLRIALFIVYAQTLGMSYFMITAILLMITAALVASIQPYKSSCVNVIDTVLLLSIAMLYFSWLILTTGYDVDILKQSAGFTTYITATVPFLYGVVFLLYWLIQRLPYVITWNLRRSTSAELLSNRMENSIAVLQEPVVDSVDSY